MANQNLAKVLDSLGLKLKEKTKSTNILSVENFATVINDIDYNNRDLIVYKNEDSVRIDLSKIINLFPDEVVNLPLCNWPTYSDSSGERITDLIELFNVIGLGYLSGETTDKYSCSIYSIHIRIEYNTIFMCGTYLDNLNIDYSTDTLKTVINKFIAAWGTTLSNSMHFGSESGETFIVTPSPVYKDAKLNTYIPPYKAIKALFVKEGE